METERCPSGYFSTWPACSPRPEAETRVAEIRATIIAVSRRAAPTRALPDDRRERLTTSAANLMAQLATPWNGEAPLRAGFRSQLCLEGWAWHDADCAADGVVQGALLRLGCGRRPTWEEGQRDYTHPWDRTEHSRCRHCGDPLGEGSRGAYCSSACRTLRARRAAAERFDSLVGLEDTALALAGGRRRERVSRAVYLEECRLRRAASAALQVPCVRCGKPFSPGWRSRALKYCSKACAHAAMRDDPARRTVAPRECEACGELFQVASNASPKKYCSRACYDRRRAERAPRGFELQCEVCSTIVRVPALNRQRTCSRRCGYILRDRGRVAGSEPAGESDPDPQAVFKCWAA